MTNRSEQDVLMALVEGDHKAFDLLFYKYFHKVRLFIQGLIKSEAEAEELAQAIFVKVWTSRLQIDPRKPFSPYLFTMARNATFNHIKHKKVRVSFAQNESLAEECTSMEDSIHARDMGNVINKSIETMPEQRKRIFRLSKFLGFSNTEIADRLNISKKTVENQLSLAVQEIRRTFRMR